MRPFFGPSSLWAYPLFAAVGGSFGYWLNGVDMAQNKMLEERKNRLLEKRKRRAEREAAASDPTKAEGGTPAGAS